MRRKSSSSSSHGCKLFHLFSGRTVKRRLPIEERDARETMYLRSRQMSRLYYLLLFFYNYNFVESNSHFKNVYLLASGKIHSRDERVAQVSVQYEIIFRRKIGNGLSNERFGILLCFYDFRAILFFFDDAR